MRIRYASACALALLAWVASVPARAATVALKHQEPSSDLPWVIGIAVLIVLALGGAWAFMRSRR